MNRLTSKVFVNHIAPERLQEIANDGMKARPFTELEWEHFRHCIECVEHFREFIQAVVRTKIKKD